MSEFRVVLVTFPTEQDALKAGERLVEEKLAACVNVIPKVRSVYRWEGRIERSEEALAVIKSEKKCFDEICRMVKNLHSYSCPEILSLPVTEGDASYLAWLQAGLRSQ